MEEILDKINAIKQEPENRDQVFREECTLRLLTLCHQNHLLLQQHQLLSQAVQEQDARIKGLELGQHMHSPVESSGEMEALTRRVTQMEDSLKKLVNLDEHCQRILELERQCQRLTDLQQLAERNALERNTLDPVRDSLTMDASPVLIETLWDNVFDKEPLWTHSKFETREALLEIVDKETRYTITKDTKNALHLACPHECSFVLKARKWKLWHIYQFTQHQKDCEFR
ncbi:hypothetical protein EDD86DRAFT_243804 [Gorgonomyces haynaldii]|nr:hypothetical protein EDD86DRAFT_243804 [Gorgonomyces haynaldii]